MFRITTPLTMSVGNGITWREWIHHPNGGGLSESDLQEIVDSELDNRNQKMSELFRSFTDQLMCSLSALGAP